MSQAHKGSSLSLKNIAVPISFSSAHFNYDYDGSGIQYGELIEPEEGAVYSIRPDGRFGGAVAVEESTTNMWTEGIISYESPNVGQLSSIDKLDETYLGQDIYRLSITPTSGNTAEDYQNDFQGHGVRSSLSFTFTSGNVYTASIYWRSVNKDDITVSGEPSNISGWDTPNTVPLDNGWNRSTMRYEHGTDQSDKKFWGFKCPSAKQDEEIIIDWACPQIEQKPFATSFVYGAREGGKLQYPKEILNPYEGTVSFWFNPLSKNPEIYSALFATGNYTSNATEDWFAIYYGEGWDNGDSIKFGIKNENGGGYVLATIDLFPQTYTWYYLVARWDFYSGVAKLTTYDTDGNIIDETFPSLDYDPPQFNGYKYVNVGYGWSGINKSNAMMDDLVVDRYFLTDEEVERRFISNKGLYNAYDYRAYAF